MAVVMMKSETRERRALAASESRLPYTPSSLRILTRDENEASSFFSETAEPRSRTPERARRTSRSTPRVRHRTRAFVVMEASHAEQSSLEEIMLSLCVLPPPDAQLCLVPLREAAHARRACDLTLPSPPAPPPPPSAPASRSVKPRTGRSTSTAATRCSWRWRAAAPTRTRRKRQPCVNVLGERGARRSRRRA